MQQVFISFCVTIQVQCSFGEQITTNENTLQLSCSKLLLNDTLCACAGASVFSVCECKLCKCVLHIETQKEKKLMLNRRLKQCFQEVSSHLLSVPIATSFTYENLKRLIYFLHVSPTFTNQQVRRINFLYLMTLFILLL